MKAFATWPMFILGLAPTVLANVASLTSELPACALQCMVGSIEKSTCAPTNTTCLCTNVALIDAIEVCTVESCTIRQQLTAKNVTETMCGAPVRDRHIIISAAGTTGGVVALMAFGLRMLSKGLRIGSPFGLDDLTICIAMCLVIPFSGLSVPLANSGLGRDMWTLQFSQITHVLYIYWFDEWIYLTIMALIKISILFFYLRVFSDPPFRRVVYTVIGLCVAYAIAFDLVSIFQCRPIKGAWHRWDGTPYQCSNENAQGWASAAINMALDVTTLILPLPVLAKLPMSRRKKAQAMLMFLVGSFDTIVGGLRLQALIRFANSTNPTWDNVPLGYWSTIEVHVGILCACLPAIRTVLRKVWPSVFGGDQTYATGGSRSSQGTVQQVLSKSGRETPNFVRLVELPQGRHTPHSAMGSYDYNSYDHNQV